MNKFSVFPVIIFLSIFIQAQTAANTSTKASDSKTAESNIPNESVKTASAGKTKIDIPPEKAKPMTIPKTSAPIIVDGKLDEEAWKSAAVFKDFYQTSPGINVAPSKPTEAYLMYDEKNLYIGFKCWDENKKIQATVAKRDSIFGEDNVGVWLDTYNDQRRAYILGFNPLGIQADGIYTEGQGSDFSVDIVMDSKGVIEDWGWSVEVRIPFKSLRYTAGKGKLWGFNATRNIHRLNNELDSWMPDDRNVSGTLIKHGKITGLDETNSERTLETVPSITLSETGRRFAVYPVTVIPDRFVNQPIRQDIGGTLKYTLTPNITLDAAYNPDFAEIEADAPVVTANQRFPLFFQEKRPFFLEGSEIFQSPIQIFYSRTIVDPDLAVKLTGKIGKTSFGFLAASDNAPGNYDEDERNDPFTRAQINEFLGKNALVGIFRVKRDIGKENNIGFFATYRGFPEQRNVAGGFDGRFKLNSKTVFSFQTVGSHSRECFFDSTFDPILDALQAQRNSEICGGGSFGGITVSGNPYDRYRTGNGFAYYANYDYTEKNREYFFTFEGRTPDYRADAGFTRRVNTNSAKFGARLSTEPKPKNFIIRANWSNYTGINYDWQGHSQDSSWNSNLSLDLQRNTSVNISVGLSYERIFESEFGLQRTPRRNGAFFGDSERSANQEYISGSIESSPSKRYTVSFFAGTIRNAFDFDSGAGPPFPRVSPSALFGDGRLDPGPGQQYDLGASVELRPADPWRISLDYEKSSLKRYDTDKTAFDSNIVTLRSTYQFTRFVFARLRADYDSLNSNISGQALFGWTPNPGTAFYVGYNDDFNYNGFNPYNGQLEPRFQRNSRTFFIRASYLFRKSF